MTTLPNGTLAYRMGQAETDIKELRAEVRMEIKSLRRALYTFALTVAGSAVIFALSVFALLAQKGG